MKIGMSKKKILFVNPDSEQCGVHQYGRRLFDILSHSERFGVGYTTSSSMAGANLFDAVIYNWHPIIDPEASVAAALSAMSPRPRIVLLHHEGGFIDDNRADMVLFSNPSGPKRFGKVRHIGRPLPKFDTFVPRDASDRIVIGLNGFMGAWADRLVQIVAKEFECALIRLALPPSSHCDPGAMLAMAMVNRCRTMAPAGFEFDVTHEFMPEHRLLEWLARNDINCYFRDYVPSTGVSSALDMALAVRRPIAINKHPMFSYLMDCVPSICVEDSSISEILRNGLSPLVTAYERNSHERVLSEVEEALSELFL